MSAAAKAFGDFRPSVWRTIALMARTRSRNVSVARRFRVVGADHIRLETPGRLRLGTTFFGFTDHRDRSLIRVRGRLHVSSTMVATGNRWDIGPDATVVVGAGTYFSPDVQLVAVDRITIGADCAIGWGSQILDADFHSLNGAPSVAPVVIGDHVWVGSHVRIYKGVTIADGCVIAGGSIVTRSVTEPGCLVAGNPARVVRRDATWH